MKRYETALVLAKIAAVDNRRLDDPEAAETPILDAWHELIGDLNIKDCMEAVATHRKRTTEWIQPAHVRTIVQEIRWDRIKDIQDGQLTPDVPGDAHGSIHAATAQARAAAVMDGMPMAQAIATIAPVAAIEARR